MKLGQLSFDYIFSRDGEKIRRFVKFQSIEISPDQYRFKINSNKMPRGVNEEVICRDEVMAALGYSVAKPVSYHKQIGVGVWLLIDREHGLGNIPVRVDYFDVVNDRDVKRPLSIAIGYAAGRTPVVIDLERETSAHFLVGGTTGGGKSSLLHCAICTLAQQPPDVVKIALFDFKRVEFKPFYQDLPHLLNGEVITDPKQFGAIIADLQAEVHTRYKMMEQTRTTSLRNYNKKLKRGDRLPYIVCFVDELAAVMLDKTIKDRSTIESALAQIASLGRACGVHLILATQRPEASVLTGLIRSCTPGRIGYACASVSDSMIIIGNGEACFHGEVPAGRAIIGYSRFRYPFQTAWIGEDQRRQIVADIIGGKLVTKTMTHDVTMAELAKYAMLHWDGKFKIEATFNQFRDRGITLTEVRELVDHHYTNPFNLGSEQYILVKPDTRKAVPPVIQKYGS